MLETTLICFSHDLARYRSFLLGFWIGGYDEHEEWFPSIPDNELLPDRPDNGYLGGQWGWSNDMPWNYVNWDYGQPQNQGSDDCVMLRTIDGKWEDFACTARLKGICEKRSKSYKPPEDSFPTCKDDSCCNGHLGVEYGGKIAPKSFSSSPTLEGYEWNTRAQFGRLNQPNKLIDLNGLKPGNDAAGGWVSAESEKNPWWAVTFYDSDTASKPFIAEVRGIMTQGLAGFKAIPKWKRYTKTYQVQYETHDGDMEYFYDSKGEIITFDGNYDKDNIVTNFFPYPVFTRKIRVIPKTWRTGAALRVELIGCKSGCMHSLGVCQDRIVNGESPINIISDSDITASSEVAGSEAKNARLCYDNNNCKEGNTPTKKTYQVYTQKSSYDSAKGKCGNQQGGAGVLGAILNDNDQQSVQSKVQTSSNPGEGECYWIGLSRQSGQWLWDDGSSLTYENWVANDGRNNACACMSVDQQFKWTTRDCKEVMPYVCQRTETGKVWVAESATVNEWLMVDLGSIMRITGIFTQGDPLGENWVTEYSLAFSDKNLNDWHDYLNHEGTAVVRFRGNHDSHGIGEGILRQPVTARYVKVKPLSWKNRIAMRIDIIGCKTSQSGKIGCQDNGQSLAEYGSAITVECPHDCDQVTPVNVYGTTKYSLESSVCQAAIHDSRVQAHNGGTVSLKFIDNTADFIGTEAHGIESKDRDAEDQAMIFQSDHLGCEEGWVKYRDMCYYQPARANGNKKRWSEARAICTELGGDLAVIPDKATSDFIYAMIRYNDDLNHVWLGLTDNGHPNYYEKWVDDTPVTFTNWDRNRPSFHSGNECVLAYRASFLWHSDDCNRNTNYICQRPVAPTNHVDKEEGCPPDGWIRYGTKCYKFMMQQEIYVHAELKCNGMIAGQSSLVTVPDSATNAWLHAKVVELVHANDHTNFWIGLHGQSYSSGQNGTTIKYLWASGECPSYTNWKTGEPGISTQCVFPFKYKAPGTALTKTYYDCVDDPEDLWYQNIGGPWCSGTDDFNRDHEFLPCSEDFFYQGCAIMSRENGQWYSDWGEFWDPTDNSGGRGCYDKQHYICEVPAEEEERPPCIPREPIAGPECLGGADWVGWDDGESKSHDCYFIHSYVNEPIDGRDDGVNFGEADAFCRSMGANLVSLHNYDENAKLIELIKDKERKGLNVRDSYFIGFNDRGERGYQWTDATAVDYTNWLAGQPEKNAPDEECAMTYSGYVQGQWYSDYCNTHAGLICGITRGKQPEPLPTHPPTIQPSQECMRTANPGETWYELEHRADGNIKCVMVVPNDSGNQDTANVKCANLGEGGTLISIHHKEELSQLTKILRQDPSYDQPAYWIGLRYRYDYSDYLTKWRWYDNSPLDYDNYAEGNPKDNQYLYDATVIHNDGRWFTEDYLTSFPYICQRWPQGAPTAPPEPERNGGCPKDWYDFKNRCYKFSGKRGATEEHLSFDMAGFKCREQEGAPEGQYAELASVPDATYDNFVFGHLYDSHGAVWLGGDANQAREWSWLDQTPWVFSYWANGEPNNANNNEYCLSMMVAENNGRWNDANCLDEKPFVCSMFKDPSLPAPSPPNPHNCPADYKPLGDHCYKVVDNQMDYEAAKASCANSASGFGYAGLATILDVHDNAYLTALINEGSYTSDSYWIGLYTDKNVVNTNGTVWLWEDNRPVSFTKWANGSPVEPAGDKSCVKMQASGRWVQEDNCNTAAKSICKLEKNYKPENHDNPGEERCDPEWWGYGGYCYIFRTGWEATEYWETSEEWCVSQGAHLASIRDDEERRALAAKSNEDLWIGLRRDESNAFSEWSDGSALAYTAWMPGEPNDGGASGISEPCAFMNSQGLWNDVTCNNWKGYVCKKPAQMSFCSVPIEQRHDCGYYGIQQDECIGYGCCWSPVEDGPGYWCFHPNNNVECLEQGGRCIPRGKVHNCDRGVVEGICSNDGHGGNDQVCCKSCTDSPKQCKAEEDEWSKQDTECVLAGGKCIFEGNECRNFIKPELGCGGPSDRQCCAPNSPPTPMPTTTHETVKTTQTTKPEGSGANVGAIVAGVFVAIVVVGAVGLYIVKQGNPLGHQQQSFQNPGNAGNVDGVVDGHDNPLQDNSNNDDDGPGGASEPVATVTTTESFNDTYASPVETPAASAQQENVYDSLDILGESTESAAPTATTVSIDNDTTTDLLF